MSDPRYHHADITWYAWAAGFFEADGGIFLGQTGRARAEITQKDHRPLFKFRQLFGGHIYRHKDGWRWRAGGDDAHKFIEKMEPFFVGVKKAQSLTALDFNREHISREKARQQLHFLKRTENHDQAAPLQSGS